MQITQIQLSTNNINETKKFYSELLGFEILSGSDSEISFNVGTSILTFSCSNGQKCVYHFAFDIPHNKLEEAMHWISLRVQLIEFQGAAVIDFPNWSAKSLYFYDNNGNVLEFIARFENDNANHHTFDSSSIVSISEIAFVTENVEQTAKDLIDNFDLRYYFRQIQREDFSVIGDDDGLIIIVKHTRNWFPTPIKVEKFSIKVTIKRNDNLIAIDYR
jgi:catechol 2,3-dioxygenase-like lactoylglutathione lyase family enzyme